MFCIDVFGVGYYKNNESQFPRIVFDAKYSMRTHLESLDDVTMKRNSSKNSDFETRGTYVVDVVGSEIYVQNYSTHSRLNPASRVDFLR